MTRDEAISECRRLVPLLEPRVDKVFSADLVRSGFGNPDAFMAWLMTMQPEGSWSVTHMDDGALTVRWLTATLH